LQSRARRSEEQKSRVETEGARVRRGVTAGAANLSKGSPKLVWWRGSVAMDGERDVCDLTNGRQGEMKTVVVVCVGRSRRGRWCRDISNYIFSRDLRTSFLQIIHYLVILSTSHHPFDDCYDGGSLDLRLRPAPLPPHSQSQVHELDLLFAVLQRNEIDWLREKQKSKPSLL
jgi:hypothetical protein